MSQLIPGFYSVLQVYHRCRATPPKHFGVAPAPPPVPGGIAPKFGSEKVSRYTGVSQLQLRVSRYTVQLRRGFFSEKGGGNSVNEGFGKDFYRRKGNSVKRSGPFSEPPDSEN